MNLILTFLAERIFYLIFRKIDFNLCSANSNIITSRNITKVNDTRGILNAKHLQKGHSLDRDKMHTGSLLMVVMYNLVCLVVTNLSSLDNNIDLQNEQTPYCSCPNKFSRKSNGSITIILRFNFVWQYSQFLLLTPFNDCIPLFSMKSELS